MPIDGDRYEENPDYVWRDARENWVYEGLKPMAAHVDEKRSVVDEKLITPLPKQGGEVFEGFTTPGPVPQADVPLEAWNEPAYIESLIEEGFPQATDEGFRFHIYRFGGGGAARSSATKREEPLRDDPKKDEPAKHKGR